MAKAVREMTDAELLEQAYRAQKSAHLCLSEYRRRRKADESRIGREQVNPAKGTARS